MYDILPTLSNGIYRRKSQIRVLVLLLCTVGCWWEIIGLAVQGISTKPEKPACPRCAKGCLWAYINTGIRLLAPSSLPGHTAVLYNAMDSQHTVCTMQSIHRALSATMTNTINNAQRCSAKRIWSSRFKKAPADEIHNYGHWLLS